MEQQLDQEVIRKKLMDYVFWVIALSIVSPILFYLIVYESVFLAIAINAVILFAGGLFYKLYKWNLIGEEDDDDSELFETNEQTTNDQASDDQASEVDEYDFDLSIIALELSKDQNERLFIFGEVKNAGIKVAFNVRVYFHLLDENSNVVFASNIRAHTLNVPGSKTSKFYGLVENYPEWQNFVIYKIQWEDHWDDRLQEDQFIELIPAVTVGQTQVEIQTNE